MEIKIIKSDERANYWTVEYNGMICEGLTWDEMLGQVAYITCPKIPEQGSLFRMEPKAA